MPVKTCEKIILPFNLCFIGLKKHYYTVAIYNAMNLLVYPTSYLAL